MYQLAANRGFLFARTNQARMLCTMAPHRNQKSIGMHLAKSREEYCVMILNAWASMLLRTVGAADA